MYINSSFLYHCNICVGMDFSCNNITVCSDWDLGCGWNFFQQHLQTLKYLCLFLLLLFFYSGVYVTNGLFVIHWRILTPVSKLNNFFLSFCPCQSGGAGGSQHAAVLQAVRSGKSSSYTGDVALLFCCWQVNKLQCSIQCYLHSLSRGIVLLIGVCSRVCGVILVGSVVSNVPQIFKLFSVKKL